MRESAHADEVHAGLGDRACPVERETAARLEQHRATELDLVGRCERNCFAHGGGVHVVEQHHVGTGAQGGAHLVDRVDLDLDGQPGRRAAHECECLLDPSRGDDVVVLHECCIAEAHAVVLTAAATHRVLLEDAQPGCGLSCVADDGAGPLHLVDPLRGDRRDSGEMAHEVECGALGSEQQLRGCGHACEHVTGRHAVTVVAHAFELCSRRAAHGLDHRGRDVDARETAVRARSERGDAALCERHGRHAGHVDAAVQVL